jgi:hypothetical protein
VIAISKNENAQPCWDHDDCEVIFRPYRKRPDGSIETAASHGKRVFCIHLKK